MSNHRSVIVEPIITEKAVMLREANTYTFKVDRRANKIQIEQAVEALFDVQVKSVRTVSVPSKPKRQGLFVGSRSGWKKAYVTLQAGEVIDLIDSV